MLIACGEERKPATSSEGLCIDLDGDGYGFQCAPGEDCDDQNSTLQTDCGCTSPTEGCECEPGTEAVDCHLPKMLSSGGGILCRTGTRYCRSGEWSACEGVAAFEVPEDVMGRMAQALVDQDAAIPCDPCHPDCYRADDPLQVVTDGGVGDNTVPVNGGGITLTSAPLDAGTEDAALLDDTTCTPGVAPDIDCDGIPDDYDPYPSQAPFATDHNTIFLDLAAGETGEESFEIQFFLNTADIYFYLDMTGSMDEERDNLIASLTSGNYLASGGAGVECADRDFDGTADNELKNEGIAGNIACLIRDSQFGTGWFRDIPFPGPFANGIEVAPYDFEMFEHRQDITSDVDAVLTSLEGFTTRGNYNWAEGGMQGLYSIVTGSELYAGWDRPGVPSRTTCPQDTWGYPCFRADAVPIVIHITDAPLQNGPATASGNLADSNPVNYDTNVLDDLTAGTEGTYRKLTASAENFQSAQYVGTVDDALVTYVGDTESMASNVTYANVGSCPAGQSAWSSSAETGKDAVFRFHVDADKEITVSSRGTRFDSTLMITRADADVVGLTYAPTGNGTVASVYDLGTLPKGVHGSITGSTSSHSEVFSRDSLGCLEGTGADDLEKAAVFKFRVAEDIPLRVASLGSSTFKVATSLMEGSTLAPTSYDLNNIMCTGAPSTVDDDCNDSFGDFSVGDVTGKFVRFINGDTNDESVNPDFPADGFVAAGCSGVSGTSDDVVYDFSVSQNTRVRIETTGQNTSLQAGFDHALALIERPATILPVLHNPSGNDSEELADAAHGAEIFESEVLPLQEGGWVQYVGNSQASSANYAQSEVGGTTAGICHNGNAGGSTAARDVVFRFDVTTPMTYDFDTFPTNPEYGYKTWLSLHKGRVDAQATKDIVNIASLDDHDFSDGSAGQGVLSASEGSLDYRQVVLQRGQMHLRNQSVTPGVMGCGSTTGTPLGGRDALFRFHLDSDTTVDLKTLSNTGTATSTGSPGFDSFIAVFRDEISAAARVTGSCGNPTGNAFSISSLALTGGHDYYVVVKHWQHSSSMTSGAGVFGLLIQDNRYSDSFVACDAGSHPNSATYSKLTAALTAGTYYLVVKGPNTGSYYDYQLNVRKTPASPPIIECAKHVNRQAFIERDLTPGNYSVVVRGTDASKKGAYNLSIRDLDAAPEPTNCHSTQSGVPSFTDTLLANDANGNPIDYYLVMRGNTTSGSYKISLDDVRSSTYACADDNTYAIGDQGQSLDDAEITMTLSAGEYLAILKGHDANDRGWFQVTFGDKTKQTTGTFNAHKWLGPTGNGVGGIRQALIDKGVRVITVASTIGNNRTADARTVEQSQALSLATGAVSSSGSALTFSINNNGTGMGTAILDAVNRLSGNLAMDVGVVLREEPDNPSPNFRFKVEAVDRPGDSCDPPFDTDNDAAHTPDTHDNCRPGATPRFKVTFQNPPPPNSVPINPSDPNGGYNMKLQLIGDGTYVVDQIPVYIIPENVVPDPPENLYAEEGAYEQNVNSVGCMSNETPDWRSLYWDATVPSGTKVTWQVCGGNNDAELGSCTWKTAGVLQSGGACSGAGDCENGYCDDSGVCHYVSGPGCQTTAECGVGGMCVSNVCMWMKNPIDLKPTLTAGLQNKKRMRVRVALSSNASRTAAPTIHNFRVDYVCGARE